MAMNGDQFRLPAEEAKRTYRFYYNINGAPDRNVMCVDVNGKEISRVSIPPYNLSRDFPGDKISVLELPLLIPGDGGSASLRITREKVAAKTESREETAKQRKARLERDMITRGGDQPKYEPNMFRFLLMLDNYWLDVLAEKYVPEAAPQPDYNPTAPPGH